MLLAGERTARAVRTARLGLLVNAVLVIVKLVTGIVGHSYALVADGVESTTDIFSSLIVWRGVTVAGRSPDERYPFGYGKAEAIAAAAVALLLLGAAGGIAVQAIREIHTPHHAPASYTLVVLVLVVAIKEFLFRYVFTVGSEVESIAVKTDAWHHRADAITSGAAFVGISVALIGGPGWASADDYAALAASLVIAANGVRFLRPALADLMDRAPDRAVLERITEKARGIDGVLGIEKILARRTGTGYRIVLHVQADPAMCLQDAHNLGGRVRSTLIHELPGVLDVVIHMEPYPGRGAPAPGAGLPAQEDEADPVPY